MCGHGRGHIHTQTHAITLIINDDVTLLITPTLVVGVYDKVPMTRFLSISSYIISSGKCKSN